MPLQLVLNNATAEILEMIIDCADNNDRYGIMSQ